MIKIWPLLFTALVLCAIGCNTPARFPIEAPLKVNMKDGIIGIWKFAEDTDKNNYYEVTASRSSVPYQYHVKFFNYGGTNATYEGNIYFSNVGGSTFINVPYLDEKTSRRGFFFLKVIDENFGFSKITTATVDDTTLWSLNSSAAVRQRISENLKNPKFYSDTVHLYKVK